MQYTAAVAKKVLSAIQL